MKATKRGRVRRWSRGVALAGVLWSLCATRASADVGATGLITTLCIPSMCCGQIQFDDQTYSVFGSDYNIVQSGVGAVGSIDTGIGLAAQGSFDGSWTQVPSGAFSFGAGGSFLCGDPGTFCTLGPVSFVGNLSNPTFPPVLAQHDWTFDGTVQYTTSPIGTVPASCPLGGGFFYEGLVAFNAFLDGLPTPAGSDVGVTLPVSYYDTRVGQSFDHTVQMTFSSVTQGGTTAATAFTSAPGQVLPSFRVNVGGQCNVSRSPCDFTADCPASEFCMGPINGGYIDVTTDAVYTPPIEMCVTLDPDWVAVLNSLGYDLDDVRLAHDESGTFQPRTSSRDPGTNTICATVDSLSFFAIGVTSCPDTPAGGCRGGAKSSLLLKNSENDASDRLIWKLTKADATTQAELADPATDDYALCLYSGSTLIDQAVVGFDASKWAALGADGYKYADMAAAADGVFSAKLKGGDAGKAKLLVKGKGANLRDLAPATLPVPSAGFPVRAQLMNARTGACWESSYAEADVKKNDVGQLKAVSMVP